MRFLKQLLLLSLLLICSESYSQYELPTPDPVINETIPSGSLVIPMDTTSQRLPGYFNLKAYGLVNYLLQNEIPVKWAISLAKTKNASGISSAADIPSTSCFRVFPDTTSSASRSFRAGPFIIESSWVATALPFINAFEASNGNNIAVYKLNAATSADIRYTLTFKPKIYLVNHQGYDSIAVAYLNEAGYSNTCWTLSTPINQVFNESGKYSMVSDAHYNGGDTTHINPILRYLNRGGNVFAECDAQGSYENQSLTLTTAGIDTVPGSITSPVYLNYKLPIAQFDGVLITPNGGYKYWKLKTGSSFRSNAYQLFRYTSTVSPFPQVTVLGGGKVKAFNQKGGNIYYLGGHDYYFSGVTPNDNNKINGRRIWLNATLIPPADTMDLDFTTDVDLSMAASGLAVKNEYLQLSIIAKNIKGGTAKNVNVQINLPAGLTYSSHTCGVGSYNSGSHIWNLGTIASKVSDTLHMTVAVTQLGTMTISANASNTALEVILPNNSATLNITGVSRPVAVNDTVLFNGAYGVDKNTRANDSDEDGGPFGNVSILSGPYNGNASVIGTDTIRYVPVVSFTGTDSLQYVTCDNYPLCDTAWLYINVLNPLPVELSHFSGTRMNEKIKLKWTTLSEKENDYFAVERSSDGKSFEDRGHVKGFGTTSSVHEYSFTDVDNLAEVLYYRLRQVDWDGKEHLSQTIALPLKNKGGLSLNVYPNPTSLNTEFIVQSTNIHGEGKLSIVDITGRVIYSKTLQSSEGKSLEIISTSSILHAGCYIVSLISESETISTKLIVK